MSIPPLVCSTPPPPEQCEDDKDPEEFDLQYNLSQDDDDDNFDYGNFSTYNRFQSTSEIKEADTPIRAKVLENEKHDETSIENKDNIEILFNINTNTEIQLKLDEDVNIEDLDLKIDQEIIEKAKNLDSYSESELVNHDSNPVTEIHIPDHLQSVNEVDDHLQSVNEVDDHLQSVNEVDSDPSLPYDSDVIEPIGSRTTEELPTPAFLDDVTEDEPDDFNIDASAPNLDSQKAIQCTDSKHTPVTESKDTLEKLQSSDNDDFGDFDDFQFASTDNNKPTTSVVSCHNPWDSNEPNDNFGDFRANFDDSESNMCNLPESVIRHSKEGIPESHDIYESEDDDFGEFDDFKSSVTETNVQAVTEESVSCQESAPVLNFQSEDTENQVMESINKVLSSIFEEEIPEPEKEFDVKLESVLNETWGHLLETDVRQPYIVNWNNSLGQKTLLKALCIDSRNILFGPKWSNMPKFAANLSVAPLQPQKQTALPNVAQIENVNPDKTAPKAAATWSDPFTSDGQDSCNPDNGNENPAPEIGPTDLDVFEATITTKPDKLYSSTLNVQPLRQINLPDTHIFTPTDSETPRSKTIHYDNSPAVLLPQTVIENNQIKSSNLTPQPGTSMNDLEDDNETWEFQDFKGTPDTLTPSAINKQTQENTVNVTSKSISKTNITYGSQVLQPIKVDPIIPTLNWPDPGEVKEVFDDFSDFVSNSSRNDEEKRDSPALTSINLTQLDITSNTEFVKTNAIKTEIDKGEPSSTSDGFDEEFDTFQSALPPAKSSALEHNSKHSSNDVSNKSSQMVSTQIHNFDFEFPKIDNLKSDTIPIANTTMPVEKSVQNIPFASSIPDNITRTAESNVRSSPIQPSSMQMSNLLQPTHVNSNAATQNHQKSAQILQPLSLESYSQINWPNPGIDLQDLSRFNPVETLQSLKSDLSTNSHSKVASPAHNHNSSVNNQADDDIWGEFVSSKPKQQNSQPKKSPAFGDDDEWTDFVSSPSVKPQNGLNTISLNVHTNLNVQKSSNQNKFTMKTNQIQLDIPSLNYITPKSSNHKTYNDRHFQNL